MQKITNSAILVSVLFISSMIGSCGIGISGSNDSPDSSEFPTSTPLAVDSLASPNPIQIQSFEEKVRLGSGLFRNAALSPDGRMIAVATTLGVWLYDSTNFEFLSLLETPSDPTYLVVWSSDNLHIAAVGSSGMIYIWDILAKRTINIIPGKEIKPFTTPSIAFSPDGEHIATTSSDHIVSMWDVSSGELVQEFDGGKEGMVMTTVAWSPDGEFLASGDELRPFATPLYVNDSTVYIWDFTTGDLLQEFESRASDIKTLAYSPDGSLIAVGTSRNLRIWELDSGNMIKQLEDLRGSVFSISWSPDGSLIATGDSGSNVKIFSVEDWERLYQWEQHTDWVVDVAWFPDGKRLLSASIDGTVLIWEETNWTKLPLPLGHTNLVSTVEWSHAGAMLASGSYDHKVIIWDIALEIPITIVNEHEGAISDIAWSPDDTALVTSGNDGDDGAVRLWDTNNGDHLSIIGEDNDSIVGVSWQSNGDLISWLVSDGRVASTNIATGKIIEISDHNMYPNWAIQWSPDGTRLAYSIQNLIYIWDPLLGQTLFTLDAHTDTVTSLAWSPNGLQLASVGTDNTMRIWDATAGDLITILEGKFGGALAWSPLGNLLVCSNREGNLIIWDVLSWEIIQTIIVNDAGIVDISWSPDGTMFATGGADGVVRIWGIVEE